MVSCSNANRSNTYIENDSIVEIIKKTTFYATEPAPKTIDWSKYDKHWINKYVGYYKGDTLYRLENNWDDMCVLNSEGKVLYFGNRNEFLINKISNKYGK